MSPDTRPSPTPSAGVSTAAPDAGGPGGVRVRSLHRSFGNNHVLSGLDLDVGPGGITGLLGPNGTGKSTFMRCVVGLLRPDSGTVRVDGVELVGDGVGVRRRMTYSPGELHLYGELRGSEHLEWLLRGREPSAGPRARELAGALGLPLDERVRGYSHGMKRQLTFAAAMAPDVPVRLLDEPTEGLDPSKRSQVLQILEEDARAGRTILLSSHHLGEVDRVCDRLVFMNDGKLIADETPASVHGRAERLLRMHWSVGADLEQIERSLSGPGVETVRREGARFTVMLEERDPRAFLARFSAQTDLPAPAGIEHGRISLAELYRDLYGVEGT